MANDPCNTDFIVLRKIPYEENAIIVNGISPEYGRLDFIVKGGNSGIKRAFPELELFRLCNIDFVFGAGSLNYIKKLELLENFDAVALNFDRYNAASWLATFSILNLMPQLPHPHFANALEVAFRRLAKTEININAILAGACLAFVFEEGWLEYAMKDSTSANQCKIILEMAAGNPPPELSEQCWKDQFEWCKNLLLFNECRLPFDQDNSTP